MALDRKFYGQCYTNLCFICSDISVLILFSTCFTEDNVLNIGLTDMILYLVIVTANLVIRIDYLQAMNASLPKFIIPIDHHDIPFHVTPNIGCGGTLNLDTKEGPFYLTSPPFVRLAMLCIWNIKFSLGKQVKFTFEHFLLLPELDNCEDAYFEIRDITGTRRFCKMGPLNKHVSSFGPKIRVILFSWQTRELDEGVRIKLELGDAPCHMTFWNVARGTLFSPNYPFSYPDNHVCSWKIRVPKNYFIRLNCLQKFWIENSSDCKHDVLLLSLDGRDDLHNALQFCGQRGPQYVESEGNIMTALFKSNQYFHYSGFRCTFIATAAEGSTEIIPSVSSDLPPTDPNICGVCGVAGSNSAHLRIVGGYVTAVNQFPWIVAVINSDAKQQCGGSLINDRYIVSAAHCFVGKKPTNIAVDLGDHNLTDNTESPAIVVGVESISIHPQYGASGIINNNDIAIIKLARSVAFTNQMRPICLPPAGFTYDDQLATVAGWGRTTTNSPSSDILRAADLKVTPISTCRRIYGFNRISENMMCAGPANINRPTDACEGDSGGPLMWLGGSRWYLIGVVSSGPPNGACGDVHFPGLYTRVSQSLQWIAANTQQDSICSTRRTNFGY